MSFQPNILAARDVFAKRVAKAYLNTWQGYGFVGADFSQERAEQLGRQMAANAFPYALQPVIRLEVDTAEVRELIAGHRAQIVRVEGDAPSGGYDLDDGVVGD